MPAQNPKRAKTTSSRPSPEPVQVPEPESGIRSSDPLRSAAIQPGGGVMAYKRFEFWCVIIIIVSFFLPWMAVGPISAAGYQVGDVLRQMPDGTNASLSLIAFLIYLVPISAVVALIFDFVVADKRMLSIVHLVAGILPMVTLGITVGHAGNNVVQGLSIGAYLTLTAGAGSLLGGIVILIGNQPRDIIPLPALIAIFFVVEFLVIWLMFPKFKQQWTTFNVRRLQNNGEFARAIPGMKRLAESTPDNPTYLAELGNAYYNIKDYDNAIKYFLLAQDHRTNLIADDQGNMPEFPDYNNVIGQTYLQKGDPVNAEKYLKLALDHNKLDKTANFNFGILEFNRGNYRKAADYFKIVSQDPGFKDKVKDYYAKIEERVFSSAK
jgi:tetratricopeptide (TPR) repeat protein